MTPLSPIEAGAREVSEVEDRPRSTTSSDFEDEPTVPGPAALAARAEARSQRD